jgi:mono/diheme cytochrome c family protein
MNSRILVYLAGAAAVGLGVGLWLTAPQQLNETEIAALTADDGDAVRGAVVFNAAGCASCHVAPGSDKTDAPLLAGGKSFPSDFGTFFAPNISPHPEAGIGGWTRSQFLRALRYGVSPEGLHYYPALPYTSYNKMSEADVADLFAYMMTLPASAVPSRAHEVGFPFSIRRGLGLWKMIYLSADYVGPANRTTEERGRYLVEALAHCGECHTPRDTFGGLDKTRWLSGAPNPVGRGRIPDLTQDGMKWSDDDLVFYLTSGLTPEFDSAGGEMVAVIENLKTLPEDDIRAIVAYLRSLP